VRRERPADVDGDVGRLNHLHVPHLPVHEVQRQVELRHHAQRDGAAAQLAVVHLPVRNRTIPLIERENDTSSLKFFLIYFSHPTTMSCL
jgi:hypothetical protein